MIDALASESDILDWKPKMPVPVLPGVDKVRIEGLPDHGHQFPEQPVIRVPSQYADVVIPGLSVPAGEHRNEDTGGELSGHQRSVNIKRDPAAHRERGAARHAVPINHMLHITDIKGAVALIEIFRAIRMNV